MEVFAVFEFIVAFLQVNGAVIDGGAFFFGEGFKDIFIFGTVFSKELEANFFAKGFAGHNKKFNPYLIDVVIHKLLEGFVLGVVKGEEGVIVSDDEKFFESKIGKGLREAFLDDLFLEYFRGNLGEHVGQFLVPFLENHDDKMVADELGSVGAFVVESLSI